MNSPKKDDSNETKASLDLVDEAKRTLVGAKNWLLEDAEIMKAYWHHKMGYMEAWVTANWQTLINQGKDALDELEEIEDEGLLWLIDHANNNPVPLADCHVTGATVEAGVYVCMSCRYEKIVDEACLLTTCDICHYGIFSTHQQINANNS